MAEQQENQNQDYQSTNDEPTMMEIEDAVSKKHVNQDRVVNWTGSEFIANHKDGRWYALYFSGLIALVATIYVLTGDEISTVSVGIVGILFVILANRKPRELPYEIDNKGLSIGTKFYPFDHFKSFGLAREGMIDYINLMPLKRFMPEISVYFPPDQSEQIVAILADHLPHDDRNEHQVDRLAKKLRF